MGLLAVLKKWAAAGGPEDPATRAAKPEALVLEPQMPPELLFFKPTQVFEWRNDRGQNSRYNPGHTYRIIPGNIQLYREAVKWREEDKIAWVDAPAANKARMSGVLTTKGS